MCACEKQDATIAVQGIALQDATAVISEEAVRIAFAIEPENATESYTLVWESSDPSIAQVAQDGTVTALKKGSTQVFVYMKERPSVQAKCMLTVASDDVVIPDERFRQALLTAFDQDGDGEISRIEAWTVKRIFVPDLHIRSLKGIEYFENLEVLDCRYNPLEPGSLDLSHNRNLRVLDCSGCSSLGALDVRENTVLDSLRCTGVRLSELDVTQNTVLRYLNCYYNNISELDLSHNPELEFLSCGVNAFTTLDVTHNPRLKDLECTFAKVPTIDLSHNPDLEQLDVRCGEIVRLDVRANTALKMLHVQSNHAMTELDVTQNTALRSLCTAKNAIEYLDVSHCVDLDTLWCENNRLTQLDLSQNRMLRRVRCAGNRLTGSLDLGHTRLDYLECHENFGLTQVVVPASVTYINCSANRIEMLDLSACRQLKMVNCSGNALTELDVTSSRELAILRCAGNRLTELDLTGLSEIWTLECYNNRLTDLDVSGNPTLRFIDCRGNASLTRIFVWEGFDPDEQSWDQNQGTIPCFRKDQTARWEVKTT